MTNESFRLNGRVVDQDQRPVAGAHVRLEPAAGSHGPARYSAVTDADGCFAFNGLAPRRYYASASKDDYYAGPAVVRPEYGESLILAMRLGTTVTIHAFADRAPVPSARLVLDHTLTATSNADGTIIVRGLAPGSYHGRLLADGFVAEPLWLSLQDDPGGVVEHHIRLRRGARIAGTVVDADGQPVPDAGVWLMRSKYDSVEYQAGSGADGAWELIAPVGTYTVLAGSRDHSMTFGPRVDCDGRTPHSDIVIRLGAPSPRHVPGSDGRPTRIAGVVVDDRGRPVVGAHVNICDTQRGFSARRGETDSRGRFDGDGFDPGAYDVLVRWPGEIPGDTEPPRRRVQTGDTNVEIVLTTGASLTGRVLFDGNPVPYYGVSLTRPNVFGGSPIGIRDADGRFSLPRIAPGTWQLAVLGPGTRLKVVADISFAAGQHLELGDLAMERGQRIVGRVRDHAGVPVAGARVIVGRCSERSSSSPVSSRIQQAFAEHFETTTDADGAYTFDGIDACQWRMRTKHIWAVRADTGVSILREVPEGDATIDHTLLEAGCIEGVVEHITGGRPTVLAIRPDEPRFARISSVDHDGRFAFYDVPCGDYVVTLNERDIEPVSPAHVTVVANQTASAMLAIAVDNIELTVKVPPGRAMDLVFEAVGSGPSAPRSRAIARMGAEESCTFHFVRPGEYRLSLDDTTRIVTLSASPAEQTIDLRS